MCQTQMKNPRAIAAKRMATLRPFNEAWASMFPEQRAAVSNGDNLSAWCCGRRSGKTNGLALWLTEGALSDPGGLSLYVCWTQYTARITLLPAFYEMKANYGLQFKETSRDNQLLVEFQNRHRIWLAGCKNSVEFGKFRGPKYRRAAWDEAQLAGEWLEEAITEAIGPALSDKGGGMVVAGTPGINPVGFFYETSSGMRGEWRNHNWTCMSNRYWPSSAALKGRTKEEYLADYRRSNRWDERHPRFVREWLGQWVKDADSLVFDYQPGRNEGEPPEHGQRYTTIGVDLGAASACAWVVVQTVVGAPEIYIVECYQREGMIPSSVAAQTERMLRKYPGSRVIIDEGGLGKGYAEEMRQTHGLAVEPAKKTERRSIIEFMRGDVLSGVIKVSPTCRELLDEWTVLQWDERHENFDERFSDHLTDAALYAYRHCRSVYTPEIVEDDSPNAQMARYRQMVSDRVRRRLKEEWRDR